METRTERRLKGSGPGPQQRPVQAQAGGGAQQLAQVLGVRQRRQRQQPPAAR